MTQVKDLHRKWLKDPEYRTEYEALEDEFQLARALVETRTRAVSQFALIQTPIRKRRR